jgi:iron complex outermembrane receptor protein
LNNESSRPARQLSRRSTLLMSTAASVLIASSALAQQARPEQTAPQSDDAILLGRVTVTADADGIVPQAMIGAETEPYAGGQVARAARMGTLGNRDVLDTSFNVTSYTDQLVADQQARDIGSIVGAYDPSVNVTSATTGNLAESFQIRGFGVTNNEIAFDGLYGILPNYRLTPEFAGRIEVLKGATALLNGMPPGGSVGGSINIVPKRAGDIPTMDTTLRYVSDAQFGGHVDLGRRFGSDKQFGVRINGVYRDGDTSVDRQEQRNAFGSLALDYRGASVRLSVDGFIQNDRTIGIVTLGLSAGLAVPDAPSASNLYSQPWTQSTTKDKGFVARGEYDVARNITAFAAYGMRHTDFSALVAGATLLNAAGDVRNDAALQRFDQDNISGEVGVRGRLETAFGRHEFSVSGVTQRQEQAFAFNRNIASGRNNIYKPFFTFAAPDIAPLLTPLRKTSVAEQSSLSFADNIFFADEAIQITVGVRRQTVRSDVFNAASGQRTSRYKEHALTPAFAVAIKPSQNMTLYANYIEGLSLGATAPVTAANAGEVFPPFRTRQYEAGFKIDFGSVFASISAFELTRPNGVIDPVTTIYSVSGRQRNRGIELNLAGQIVPSLRLLGGASFTDPKQTRNAGGVNEGNDAVGTPRFMAKLGVEWEPQVINGLTTALNLIHTGKQYLNATNSLQISGWTRFDMGLRYRQIVGQTPLTLRLDAQNLLGRDYWQSGSSGLLTLGTPRTLLTSLTASF